MSPSYFTTYLLYSFTIHLQLQATEGEIYFFSQPGNVIIEELGTAIFNCTYNGTNAVPGWRINGVVHSWSEFPFMNHSITPINTPDGIFGCQMNVFNVQVEMNSTKYECGFFGTFPPTVSNFGFLYVEFRIRESIVMHNYETTEFAVHPKTTREYASSKTIIFHGDTTSDMDRSIVSQTNTIASDDSLPKDILRSVSIIAAAIFFAMVSTTVVVFGVCVIYRKQKDRKVVNATSDANNNPIYEEIEDVVRHTDESGEIGTANNEAYGINKKQGFDMQECDAYTVISIANNS